MLHKIRKKVSNIDDILRIPLKKSFIHRIPWLLIGLFGGIIAAKIVKSFQEVLSENLILVAYIPLIVYMSDAVGTQMEAFVIRDFVLHPRLNFLKYFLKHFLVVLLIGIILSASLFTITIFSNNQLRISLVISISLLIAIISSMITGLVLPLVFKQSKTDPANASGPIATVIQDILSVTIYLMVAHLLLG